MLIRLTVSFIFLFVAVKNISAQWVNMPTTIRTPNGNVKINTPTYMPMYRNYYGQAKPQNHRHVYTIIFLNDSTVTEKAIINIGDSIHSLTWGKKDKKMTVTPSMTKEIFRINNDGRKITGKPLDSCWIFLLDSGKINTYIITSEVDDPATVASYVQKGWNAPILLLTEESLREMVKDNDKAMKLIEKKKILKAIEVYNKQ